MRMNLAKIGAAFLVSTEFVCAQVELNLPEKTREELVTLYQTAGEYLKLCSPYYAAKASNTVARLRIFDVPKLAGPPARAIDGELLLQVWPDSLRILSIENRCMFDKYDSREAIKHSPTLQTTSTLNSTDAVERAKEYLKVFKMPLPPEFREPDVRFNYIKKSRWEVRWHRFSGQYAWDDGRAGAGGTVTGETVWVIFHEKDGLQSLGNGSYSPEPKRLEVKFSKEEAIAKAEKCVPLVQRTPFYRDRRRDGFVTKTLMSCELKVAVPNWLLDPKRATWIGNNAPKETRLCWIVRFETRDTKERKDEQGKTYKLMSPQITIYIDAATGEVVGAMFT